MKKKIEMNTVKAITKLWDDCAKEQRKQNKKDRKNKVQNIWNNIEDEIARLENLGISIFKKDL